MKIICFLDSTYKSADNLQEILLGSEDEAHRELSFGMYVAVQIKRYQQILIFGSEMIMPKYSSCKLPSNFLVRRA